MSREKSEFNYGIDWLRTLRTIENQCNQCAMNQDYENWLRTIKTFYRELYRRMDNKQRDNIWDTIGEAQKLVSNHNNVDPALIEKYLTRSELQLRNVMKDLGMDMKVQQDPGDALLGENF